MSTPVPLHTAGDGVRVVGPDPIAPAGTVFFSFDGVTAVIDPVSETPQLLVHDLDAAVGLVADVFGDAVAGELDSDADVTVEAPRTHEAVALHRAGLLAWLNDIRPLPLDPELIGLESAVATADLPWAPVSPLDTTAAPAATIEGIAHLLRSLRTQDHGLTHRPLSGLARRALAHLPVGNETLWPELARERALLRASGSQTELAALSPADAAWLRGLLAMQKAAHLGTAGTTTASLDWLRVPRRFVPAPEDSVVFSVEPAARGAGRLLVTVAVTPAPRLHPALLHPPPDPSGPIVSLAALGWPLPLATGQLTLQRDGRAWSGEVGITPDAMDVVAQADELVVDVRSAHLPWRAPDPVREARATARRWAARGVAGLRLATAVDDLGWAQLAGGGLAYAARLWRGLDPSAAGRCLELADGGVVRSSLSVAETWLLETGGSA